MEKVFIDLGKDSYYIYIQNQIINYIDDYIGNTDKIMIIIDENVYHLYGKIITEAIKERELYKFIINPGESSKNFATVQDLLSQMLKLNFTRKSKILAVGGGVVGDIAGFTASIYMRGIPFLQIPTTLLAQVDSSVGGKTGVNLPNGKNIVGSFYQPQKVLIDIDTLKTLPRKEVISGLGEIIKYGIIWDYEFLKQIKNGLEDIFRIEKNTMKRIISKCCRIKAEIVSKDEKEMGLRKILNHGHTIGHALETVSHYKRYTHGEAILIGMYYESIMAKNLGYIEKDYFEEIQEIIKMVEIDLNISEFPIKDLIEIMKSDKKNRDSKISFILPSGRGSVEEVLLNGGEILW